MSEPMTDAEVVAQANALCRDLAGNQGWHVPEGHQFHEDPSPRAKVYWAAAKVAFEFLRQTDIDDAVSGLGPVEKEFAFDVLLSGFLRVKAPSEERAREILAEVFDGASMSVESDGLLPPVFEGSLADRPTLQEIDGEAI